MMIQVNGMMCRHCEAHVNKALEAVPGAAKAEASHEGNYVTITKSGDVDENAMKAAIEEAGYTYGGILA